MKKVKYEMKVNFNRNGDENELVFEFNTYSELKEQYLKVIDYNYVESIQCKEITVEEKQLTMMI